MAVLPNRRINRVAIAASQRLLAKQDFALKLDGDSPRYDLDQIDFRITKTPRFGPDTQGKSCRASAMKDAGFL